MKTILVPTDFSAASLQAAHYALSLAGTLHTGICLIHAFQVPLEVSVAAQIAWPLEDYASVKAHVTGELDALANQLETMRNDGAYHPAISYSSEIGRVKDVIRNEVAEQQLNLVVMGMSGAGGLSRVLLGSQSRELIDVAPFPVLLIPANTAYAPVHKIAFATDLGLEDVEVVHALAGLAQMLNADLLIAHCTDEKYETGTQGRQVEAFLADVTSKAGYDKIYYRHIKSTGIDRGLDWLSEHGQVDVMAMVHHPEHFLSKLLSGSHTKNIAGHIPIPLMVFPPGYCGAF